MEKATIFWLLRHVGALVSSNALHVEDRHTQGAVVGGGVTVYIQ